MLNSISKISQNPNTSYIMETDPNFTNRRNFLSSDYVLNRLKLDPMNVQKRLGDGYCLLYTSKSKIDASDLSSSV